MLARRQCQCLPSTPGFVAAQQRLIVDNTAVTWLQASHPGEGGIWVDGSSASLGRDAGVSSAYTGSLSREEAVLKLQAGARGYLTRKQIRLQRQQQGDALVLVQVCADCLHPPGTGVPSSR